MSDPNLVFTQTEDISEEIIKILRDHIGSQVPEIQKTYWEWPTGSQTLVMPALRVATSGAPEFLKSMNRPILKVSPLNPDDTVDFVREIGFYEYSLQLDLWTTNKNERTSLYKKVFDVLNPETADNNTSGLHLRMPDYFNQLASFTLTSYNYEDNEISAQRREWRVIFEVLANVRAVRAYNHPGMVDIQLDAETFNEFEDF